MAGKYKFWARVRKHKLGAGLIYTNWGLGPLNTNWVSGPEAGKYKDPSKLLSQIFIKRKTKKKAKTKTFKKTHRKIVEVVSRYSSN